MAIKKRALIVMVVAICGVCGVANAQYGRDRYGADPYAGSGGGSRGPTYSSPTYSEPQTYPVDRYGQPYNGLNGLPDTGGSTIRNGAPPPGSLLAPRRY